MKTIIAHTSETPFFPLGQVVLTRGVENVLGALDLLGTFTVAEMLQRHVSGDWGDLCEEDAHANRLAVENGCRVFSAYTYYDTKFWVITEWDRSVTTILLPHEY